MPASAIRDLDFFAIENKLRAGSGRLPILRKADPEMYDFLTSKRILSGFHETNLFVPRTAQPARAQCGAGCCSRPSSPPSQTPLA